MEAKEVMDIKEAAEYLGLSTDTIYKYIYKNKIPAFKLGNRWRFKKAILDRWMEEKIEKREPYRNLFSRAKK